MFQLFYPLSYHISMNKYKIILNFYAKLQNRKKINTYKIYHFIICGGFKKDFIGLTLYV